MTQKDTLFIGIDVGGTSCQAAAYTRSGKVVAQAQSASVNLGIDVLLVIRALEDVLAQLTQSLGRSVVELPIGIGCAGYSHLAAREQVILWAQQYPHCQITSDIHIATLAANAGDECAVVIVGTGTCGAQYYHNQLRQIGGVGLLLGDQGSGAWLGLQASKHVLAVADQFAAPSLLSKTLSSQLSTKAAASITEHHSTDIDKTQSLVQYFNQMSSHDFAQIAPLVFNCAEQGDAVAKDLVKRGLDHIDKLVQRVSSEGTLPVFYVGGVMQPYIGFAQQTFPEHALLHTALQPCRYPSEYGAMLFAQTGQQPTLVD